MENGLPPKATFGSTVHGLLSRYFRSARVILLGRYGALEEPPYELFAALSRPLLIFTHELEVHGERQEDLEDEIDDDCPLGNVTTDDRATPVPSSGSNLFILPQHSEIGVVLMFATVRQFRRYCEDNHPLHNLVFLNPFNKDIEDQLVELTVFADAANFLNVSDKLKIFDGMPIRCTVFPRNPTLLYWETLPESFRNIPYVRHSAQAANGSSGLDGMVLGNLAEALNFTAETMDASDRQEYGYRLANDTFVGSLGDLLQYRSDVSFNVRFMKYYDTNAVEFLQPIYSDQLCVLSPKSLKIPEWLAIFLCFHPYVWATFVTIGFAGGYAWYGLRRWALRKVQRYGDLPRTGDRARCSTLSIELWMVLLGASSTHLPVRALERLLLLAFLVANVIISGTFQGTLTTAFSTTSFYKDINTLAMLDRAGLPIGTSSRSLLDIFGNDSYSALYRSLNGKLQILNESARHRAAYERDICCIERRSDVPLIVNTEYIRPDGQPMLHVVEECPRVYSLAYIVRKGWPFAPLFNNAILRFVEAGLCMKWHGDTEDALTLRGRVRQMRERQTEPTLRKLTLIDMQTSFYIIVLGVARFDQHQRKESTTSTSAKGPPQDGPGIGTGQNRFNLPSTDFSSNGSCIFAPFILHAPPVPSWKSCCKSRDKKKASEEVGGRRDPRTMRAEMGTVRLRLGGGEGTGERDNQSDHQRRQERTSENGRFGTFVFFSRKFDPDPKAPKLEQLARRFHWPAVAVRDWISSQQAAGSPFSRLDALSVAQSSGGRKAHSNTTGWPHGLAHGTVNPSVLGVRREKGLQVSPPVLR
uniref:Ionotropic glutamate receptor C-terminal domain-containing protein n=1 Tax=Anopheles atroparvus TaxID=41427 RepID=A0A182J6R5_ANOAO